MQDGGRGTGGRCVGGRYKREVEVLVGARGR